MALRCRRLSLFREFMARDLRSLRIWEIMAFNRNLPEALDDQADSIEVAANILWITLETDTLKNCLLRIGNMCRQIHGILWPVRSGK